MRIKLIRKEKSIGPFNRTLITFILSIAIPGFIMFYSTNNFQPDLILAVGSRTSKQTDAYLWSYKDLGEGSVDFISVFGLQKGKSEFIKCLETTSRQTVSRFNGESIHSRSLPHSFGFHLKGTQDISICGMHLDNKLGCEFISQ